MHKSPVAAFAVLLLKALRAAGTWLGTRIYRAKSAPQSALPEIERLLRNGEIDAAFRLGQQAERYIPNDPELLRLRSRYAALASVASDPPGADVYVKGYRDVDATWTYLGKTPLRPAVVPNWNLRWKLTKEGFASVEGVSVFSFPANFTLHPHNTAPPGMVFIPGVIFRYPPSVFLQ